MDARPSPDPSAQDTLRRPPWQRAARVLTLALIVVAVVVALETWRRHELYWYDVRQDYSYSFGVNASRFLRVPVTSEGVTLPQWSGGPYIAVLKLRVSSTPSGWWFDPCVEITTPAGHDRQCFDRGGKGDRYVLLPRSVVEPGKRVALEGAHLHWAEQIAQLVLFDAPDMRGSRILVLAPHPDDAEIAAFGLYSSNESFIVTITAGNYVDGLYAGLYRDDSMQDSLRGQVRTWDSLAVPMWGGVAPDRLASLGYPTYSLRAYYEAAEAGTEAPESIRAVPDAYRQGALDRLLGDRSPAPEWESVVADLASVLQRVRPDAVVTPHPALDDHTDHQFTTVALLEALERLQDRTTLLLLYNNHHVLSEHYPFGPSDARVTLPPWFGAGSFASLYSHELDASTQMRKLFALEAMHDLRGPPQRLTGGPAEVLATRLKQALDTIGRDPFGDYSYFRRAVRPNEIFFVYGPADRGLIRLPARSRRVIVDPVTADEEMQTMTSQLP